MASRELSSFSVKSAVRTEASDPDDPRAPASAACIKALKLGNFLIVSSNVAFSWASSASVFAMMIEVVREGGWCVRCLAGIPTVGNDGVGVNVNVNVFF